MKLVINDFDTHEFVSQIMDDEWEKRELKQRVAHITTILRKFLPTDYKEAIAKILELLDYVERAQPDFSKIDDTKFGLILEYGAILDNYVEQYGLDDYETSVKAIGKITQISTPEVKVGESVEFSFNLLNNSKEIPSWTSPGCCNNQRKRI